jgi:L-fuconolactonase
MDDWLPHFKAASRFPNIFCKLSGMITEADWQNWTTADLKPYVRTALECFGPNRCMFGSDWPVCQVAGSYQQAYVALDDTLGPIAESERAAIWHGTAAHFYRLGKHDKGPQAYS